MAEKETTKEDKLDRFQQDFASTMSDTAGSYRSDIVNISSTNTSTIENLFQAPETNYSQIASYMTALYKKNGIIGGTVKYYQSHPTYNFSIYPTMNVKSGYEMSTEISEYIEVANHIEQFNIRYYAPYFLKETLLNGVSYFYKIQDSKGVSFMKFPPSFCRVYEMNTGVFRWELDMSKIPAGVLTLPSEITKAKEQHVAGSTDDIKKWTDGKWYKLSDKAVAFALDQSVLEYGTSVSELATVILDSLQVEKAKVNIDIKETIDTVRILHSEIPTDKDGKPLMSGKTAKIYDTQLKRALPKGIVGVTSPMKLTNVPMNNAGNTKVYETVDKAQDQLFLSTGTPSNLFGSDTTSSNIVKLSVQKDANWIYTKVFPMLENFYNYELSKFKAVSGMTWKMKFVRQSNFTIKDDVAIAEKQLTLGGSRLEFLASTGLSPVEVYGRLLMEQKMLNIDTFMIPKQTSFTMGSETGRPSTDNPTDDTDRINDAM